MKLNIAFDLDCCLCDFFSGLRETLAETGRMIVPNDTYEIKTAPPANKQLMAEAFKRTYKLYKRTPFFKGAAELCYQLHIKSLQPIMIVTHRPIWSAHWTHQLVSSNLRIEGKLPIPYILCFADKLIGKSRYINGIRFFVEDRRMIARELARNGKCVFVPKYYWNEMPDSNDNPNIWRISGIDKLLPYADKFIIKENRHEKLEETFKNLAGHTQAVKQKNRWL